ncbi:MAG: hypothetical protein LAT66_14290, partial [Alkalimonas sp.]|nr:hypothetical protein [Alkalimonas sp.]
MRRFLRVTSLILTLLLFVLLALFFWLQQQIKQLPVQQLDYQIQSIGWRQLQLNHLQFDIMLEQQPLNVQIKQLQLSWRWQSFGPQLQLLELQQLQLNLANFPSPTETSTADKAEWQLPEQWQWPAWLPRHTRISQLTLDLPCGSNDKPSNSGKSRCIYLGSLQLSQDEHLTAELKLRDPDQSTTDQLQLHLHYQLQQQWPELALQLSIDQWLELQLDSSLAESTSINAPHAAPLPEHSDTHWQGELELMVQPLPDWLLTQLAHWQVELPEHWLEQFQQPVSAGSNWQLFVPSELNQQAWQHLSGYWQLQLSSPSPIYLPGVGLLTAEIQASAQFQQGQLAPFRLAAGGQLSELSWPEALREAGAASKTFSWSLSSQQTTALSLQALPLQIRLSSDDRQYQLLAGFELDLLNQQASIDQLQVKLQQPSLHLDDWQLTALQLDAEFSGHLSNNALLLQSKAPIRLQSQLSNEELALVIPTVDFTWQDVTIQLSGAATEQASLQLSSTLSLKAQQLQHPVVKPLDWHWHGSLSAEQSPQQWQADINGKLETSSGLELQQQLTANAQQLQLDWQLADVFILAGNTLASTLADWPELLTLQRGRIRHQGQLILPLNESHWQLHSDTNLVDLSGFYDTTTFSGLNSQLLLEANAEQLTVTTPGLKVEQIEQGIVAGPLH